MAVMRQKRFLIIFLGFLGLVILAVLCSISIKQLNYYLQYPGAGTEPSGTANALVKALQSNNVEVATAMVAKELEPEIRSWLSNHQPVKCQGSLTEASLTSVGSRPVDQDNIAFYSIRIQEPCFTSEYPRRWYCLTVEDIVVEQKEGVWKVTQFGQIIESWNKGPCP